MLGQECSITRCAVVLVSLDPDALLLAGIDFAPAIDTAATDSDTFTFGTLGDRTVKTDINERTITTSEAAKTNVFAPEFQMGEDALQYFMLVGELHQSACRFKQETGRSKHRTVYGFRDGCPDTPVSTPFGFDRGLRIKELAFFI